VTMVVVVGLQQTGEEAICTFFCRSRGKEMS
jgi:hypothetical protein